MKNSIYILLVLFLLSTCKKAPVESGKIDVSSLYLPDMNLLDEDYEYIDSTKAYGKLAQKIHRLNRDLQASQMYVDAAWFFEKAGQKDSVVNMLHKAIDRGMSNPNILQKFSIEESIPETEQWIMLDSRLDSIQLELKNISHFSVEMKSMNEFWDYWQKAMNDSSRAKEIFKEYIFEGPEEIRDFYVVRYDNPTNMYGQMINGTPAYYEYLKNYLQPDSLTALNSKTTAWMRNFQKIYPQAVFPKVFIVPGILNSGGTATEMGIFVGGDMYGRSEEMPTEGLNDWQKGAIMKFSDLPALILHELMHFHQSYGDREIEETVLMGIIIEGVCDFLVELSSGNQLQNDNLKYLEDPHNRNFIFEELRQELFLKDSSKWLYNGGSIEDRPYDLGYTIGYLITKSYYNLQEDKQKAVYELLNTDDVVSILRQSEYSFLLEDNVISADSNL